MNKISAAICVAMLAVPCIAVAGGPGCDTVNISKEVMEKFPKIRSACQAVKERDGGIYMLFVGEVQEVSGKEMTVIVRDKDGKDATQMKLAFSPDQTITAQGRELKLADLKSGMKLDFWVEHAKWGLYSKPGGGKVTVVERKEL